MHDLTTIGPEPAGITAAIYAARKRLNLPVTTKDLRGQTTIG